MTLARYFVTRSRDEWLVTLDGRPVGRHDTKAEAVEDAIAMAAHMGGMEHDADVVVERGAGARPERVWTFGKDPLPRSGYEDDARASHIRRVQRAATP